MIRNLLIILLLGFLAQLNACCCKPSSYEDVFQEEKDSTTQPANEETEVNEEVKENKATDDAETEENKTLSLYDLKKTTSEYSTKINELDNKIYDLNWSIDSNSLSNDDFMKLSDEMNSLLEEFDQVVEEMLDLADDDYNEKLTNVKISDQDRQNWYNYLENRKTEIEKKVIKLKKERKIEVFSDLEFDEEFYDANADEDFNQTEELEDAESFDSTNVDEELFEVEEEPELE